MSGPAGRRPAAGLAEAITLGDLLLRTSGSDPDREALVFPDERLSYVQLVRRAREIARGLIAIGVERGEHVGILMANSSELVASLFAVTLVGAVAVPINTRYRAVELPYVVENGELVAILTSDRIDDYVDLLELLGGALPGLSGSADPLQLTLVSARRLRSVVVFGSRPAQGTIGERELDRLAADVSERELEDRRAGVRVRDVAVMLYTSGTTAQPRGCRLTHEALVRNWTEVARILGVTQAERWWAPCPLFHLGAIGPLIASVACGCTFVSDTYFEPDRALALVERERVSVLYPAYPPITQALLGHPRYAQSDLSAARVIVNVAPPDTLRQMQAAIPQATQLSLYGLTEGGGAVTYNTLDEPLQARLQSCGLPLPGTEVRVLDPDDGTPLAPGLAGEIAIRGVGLCEGYHRDPEKTALAFGEDGWFHTGDLGSLDAAGRLRFLGRIKEMLKVGGENVAPAEIESHLSTHPAVKLAQVVGLPDQRLEEVPFAFVELRPGCAADELELLEHCRGRIASFKVPRGVRFVSEWPMSATKIQKGPLRERLLSEPSLRG